MAHTKCSRIDYQNRLKSGEWLWPIGKLARTLGICPTRLLSHPAPAAIFQNCDEYHRHLDTREIHGILTIALIIQNQLCFG